MTIETARLPLTLPHVTPVNSAVKTTASTQQAGMSFDQILQSLSNTQNNSDSLIQDLAVGNDVDLPQLMISAEQTDISFRIALAIRDRLVEAYKEVVRIQV